MPKVLIEYARSANIGHNPGQSSTLTLEQRSGEWLAGSLSGKSPGKTLYLGKFLNPAFVASSYANFIETGAWDEIDVIFWKKPDNPPCTGYPNLHFPERTADRLDNHIDADYDVICVDDLLSYLTPLERSALAVKLVAMLAPGGRIHIANRHLMRTDAQVVHSEWLASGGYFQDAWHPAPPEEIISTFSTADHSTALNRNTFDPALHFTEHLAGTGKNTHLQTLFSALYFLTIVPDHA